MDKREARRHEREGMERRERRLRKDRRDEKRGMEKFEKGKDHHGRHHRAHHSFDDDHLERQKVHCDRRRGIDRVLQDKRTDALSSHAQSGKMHNRGEAHWKRGDRMTPRGA